MEAGGDGELSHDEGSSAPYSPHPQAKEEEMLIKEERETGGGGGELPQDKGSCASYSSSPVTKVNKEEMAIKEEREPKRQKTATGNEAEQTDSE